MRMKYISRTLSELKKYKVIYTKRNTSRVLEGAYKSVYKGRSMSFEDLREYVSGDDIKDVDWKATARNNKMLVREYIADKKHNIMLVTDANRRMLAETKDGQEKRELALLSAGTMSYLVNRNGDYVSFAYATSEKIKHFPFKSSLANIEMMLSSYHDAVTMDNKTEINETLDYIVHNFRHPMIVVIVADMDGLLSVTEEMLKRVVMLHDVLVINIADADIYGESVYDIENGDYLPSYVTSSKKLKKLRIKEVEQTKRSIENVFNRHGVPMVTINASEELGAKMMELFEKNKIERRTSHG